MGFATAGWEAAEGAHQEGRETVLCASENGRVIRCGCCGRLELAMGNVVLFLGEDDLAAVRDVLDGFAADGPPVPGESARPFVVRTESDTVAFALTRAEVREMGALVRDARRALRPGTTRSRPRRHEN
jgi:hypothetical protein